MTDAEKVAAVRKLCWTTIEEDKSVYAVARFAASILDIIGRQRDEGRAMPAEVAAPGMYAEMFPHSLHEGR